MLPAANMQKIHLENILLFALVSFITQLPVFLNQLMVLNTGFGEIRYTRIVFQFLPMLYIINKNFKNRSIKFIHFFIFALTVLTFIFIERYMTPLDYGAPNLFRFLHWQIHSYIFFLMLVNFGTNSETFYKIINYTFYSILIMCLISYAGNLGLFRISIYSPLEDSFFTGSTKPHSILQVNRISYLYVFGMLMLIVKQLAKNTFSRIYHFINICYIALLFAMIIHNSSRGAFLIGFILFLYYFYIIFKHMTFRRETILLIISSVSLLLSLTICLKIVPKLIQASSKLTVVSYFQNFEGNTVNRTMNAINAWNNLKENPFWGVGYNNAAKRGFTGTRCNNQFLHMAASSGIFFLFIYLFYNYRLIVYKSRLLKKPEIFLSALFCLNLMLWTLPLYIFAISGYMAYYFHINKPILKRKKMFPDGCLK